jgi:hypothetical protein
MSVLMDSYMGMFLPEDIGPRIIHFIEGRIQFPFINGNELMGVFFIFGKNHGLSDKNNILEATDLAKRTIASLTNTARSYHVSATAEDSTFIRHNYAKNILQLSVELSSDPAIGYHSQVQRNRRIAGDPRILTDCYSQHIAYFRQDQIFEIFPPFDDQNLPSSLKKKLEGRMILLGYNVKDTNSLPYSSTLFPFLDWLNKVDTKQ